MTASLPPSLSTQVAWQFNAVLAGSFRRNKADFAHLEYPVLGPLPGSGRNTAPKERSAATGPFIYFVVDDQEHVRYIGKSMEDQVLRRWMRPGVGGPADYYWTHSTRTGGCVFLIARGLQSGESRHYTLRYAAVADLPKQLVSGLDALAAVSLASAAAHAEKALIRALRPDWNKA